MSYELRVAQYPSKAIVSSKLVEEFEGAQRLRGIWKLIRDLEFGIISFQSMLAAPVRIRGNKLSFLFGSSEIFNIFDLWN